MAGAPVFELDEGSVHVWPVRTNAPDYVADAYAALLSPDERDRAQRFRFEHLQRGYATTRGVLRVLLGKYLKQPARDVELAYGTRGKPSLRTPGALEFNASHTGGLALYAFTHGCPIGVDVEHIRPVDGMSDIAQRFFCSEECADLMSVDPASRQRAFFLCWTRKEAYIKAVGDGLSIPLDAFRVTVRPGEPARIIDIHDDNARADQWVIENLEVDMNYAAALAYCCSRRKVALLPVVDAAQLLPYSNSSTSTK